MRNNNKPRQANSSGSADTSPHLGWYAPRNLPHFDSPTVVRHITYRLIDLLPREVMEDFEKSVEAVTDKNARNGELRRRIEAYLDAGHGACVLAEPEVAACVIDTWRHFDGVRYHLLEWVVMPNHCHVLIEPLAGAPLGKMVLSRKNYTARFIKDYLGRSGRDNIGRVAEEGAGKAAPQSGSKSHSAPHPVRQRDYWDRIIRNENHLAAVRENIVMNPVKAGLVKRPEEWPWSSAAFRAMK